MKIYGFSLMELLIVLVIIGVLAGTGISIYQSYITRSEIAVAHMEASGLKTLISSCLLNQRNVTIVSENINPDDCNSLGISDSKVATFSGSGNYATGIATINIKMLTPALEADAVLSLNRNNAGVWTCTGNNISSSLLPKGCSTGNDNN